MNINGVAAVNAQLQIYDAAPQNPGGSIRYSQWVGDTTPQAANVGSGVGFALKYDTAGNMRVVAGITPYKLNGTTGDHSAGLKFTVRNLSGFVDAINIAPNGTLTFQATDPVTLAAGNGVALGEIPAGTQLQTSNSNLSLYAGSLNGAAGLKLAAAYYNGSAWKSALEVANVASGFGTLLLMKGGGNVGIGGTPTCALDVIGNTAAQARFKAASTGVSSIIRFEDAATTPNVYFVGTGLNQTTDGSFFVFDATRTAVRLSVDITGNVAFNHSNGSGTVSGGGQGVIALVNAAVAPTYNNALGSILYVQGGATKIRGSSGTVTTIAPAEPHCPRCGADFGHEFYNARYGYVSICLFCLAEDLGDKPYIIRYQTEEHRGAAAARNADAIGDARAERLSDALAFLAVDRSLQASEGEVSIPAEAGA